MLLSLWGGKWRKANLVMFTVFIDDSGTSPSQSVAIATALIIPAKKLLQLESEWGNLKDKFGFTEFRTSEFAARNAKREYGSWDDEKRKKLFQRVVQITKKYGVKAFTHAVNKRDFDEVAPEKIKFYLGRHHYTWAVRHIVAHVDDWLRRHRHPPCEWVFQWMGSPREERRVEVESVMDQAQYVADRMNLGGVYTNYSFRYSRDIPGLQCVDAVAWVSYQHALLLFRDTPPHEFAQVGWRDFTANGWLSGRTILRDKLKKSFDQAMSDEKHFQFMKDWQASRGQKSK